MPLSRAERDFAKAFASAINHATAAVAANPRLPVTGGSIADLVREAYTRFEAPDRSTVAQRARAAFSTSDPRRQRYFGAYADRAPEIWSKAGPGLDPELREGLKKAVRARLDAQRDSIAEQLALGVGAQYFGRRTVGKTTLEVGSFGGDVELAETKLTVSTPQAIELRWSTTVAGAELGTWRMTRTAKLGARAPVLGWGNAGKAPGGVFTINLADFLPAKPPASPAKYVIRVTPKTATKIMPGRSPGQTFKVPGKAVGPPSNDVVITYSAVGTPAVHFDIFDIYQELYFNLHSIEMVRDQTGPGVEEFHVTGFVQQLVANSTAPIQRHIFPTKSVNIDPDGKRTKYLGGWEGFSLPKPDAVQWPRAYIGAFSVMEEDDGGALAEWQAHFATVVETLVDGEVTEEVMNYLEDQFKDYLGDNIGQIAQAGGQVAETIALIISGEVLGIIGAVVAAAGLVAGGIISGMDDDFYGTQPFAFVLPTNITDYVHQLPGHAEENGYRLEAEDLYFRGLSSWPEATTYDGEVLVWYYWRFGAKAQS